MLQDYNLCLVKDEADRLVFKSNSLIPAVCFLALSIVFFYCAAVGVEFDSPPMNEDTTFMTWSVMGVVAFCVAVSFYGFNQTLEINNRTKTIHFESRTLRKKTEWKKNFTDFTGVKLEKVVGNETDVWATLLYAHDSLRIPLKPSIMGYNNRKQKTKAKKFASKIADFTDLTLITS